MKHLFMLLFLIIYSYKQHTYIHTHTNIYIHTQNLYKQPFFYVRHRIEQCGIAVLENMFTRKDGRNNTACRKIHCLASDCQTKMLTILWRFSPFLIEQLNTSVTILLLNFSLSIIWIIYLLQWILLSTILNICSMS